MSDTNPRREEEKGKERDWQVTTRGPGSDMVTLDSHLFPGCGHTRGKTFSGGPDFWGAD